MDFSELFDAMNEQDKSRWRWQEFRKRVDQAVSEKYGFQPEPEKANDPGYIQDKVTKMKWLNSLTVGDAERLASIQIDPVN